MSMKYQEVHWFEMSPDLYAGDTCDQVKPRWHCSSDGDKGDSEFVTILEMAAEHFPPGTKITVEEPCCPTCHLVAGICSCGFDWDTWRNGRYQ